MRVSMRSDLAAGVDGRADAGVEAGGEAGRRGAGEVATKPAPYEHKVHECVRDRMLTGVARSTEGLLANLGAGAGADPARQRDTQRLQQALETHAQDLLQEHLRDAVADIESPPHPPDLSLAAATRLEPQLLAAVADMARDADVEGSRRQLTQAVCLASNRLRRSLSTATDVELSTWRVEIEDEPGGEARSTADAEIRFDALVEQVRQRYGGGGGGSVGVAGSASASVSAPGGARFLATEGRANPRMKPMRTAAAIEPEVEALVASLLPGLTDALRRLGLDPAAHQAQSQQALREAAIILVDHGLSTPEQARAFLDQVNRHDERLALFTGVLAQVGYPVGMAAFLWGVAPPLAPSLLGTAGGVTGAVAFGALAGAMIGWSDSIAGSGASAVYRALAYAGSATSVSPLAGKLRQPQARELGVRAGLSASATFAKNALLRAVIPSVVYGLAFPGGLNREVRDYVDFAGDAGGGFFSGGAAAVLTRRWLDSRPARDFKLLTQENLPGLIQRAGAGDPWRRTVSQSLSAYGRGLATGALAPSTWAVTGLVMTPLVALLMGINLGLVPQLGWSDALGSSGGTEGPDDVSGPAINGTMEAGTSAELISVAEHALKATVSTLLMAVLAGGATGVGNWVGRRADADCLAAVFGAVRMAAERLRDAVAPAERSGDVALTGLRRRSTADGEWQRY